MLISKQKKGTLYSLFLQINSFRSLIKKELIFNARK